MHRQPQKRFFIGYTMVLAMVSYWALDMYLPALTRIEAEFNSSAIAAAASVSVYLLGLAFAQLFYGPISDQLGRKPTLLAGLFIALVGTLGCYLSQDITSLLVFRALQAIGFCSALVLWQTMVVDVYPEKEVHKRVSFVVGFLGLSPALAPFFGGFLVDMAGWRIIFGFLLLVCLGLLGWTQWGYQESLDKSPQMSAKKNTKQASIAGGVFKTVFSSYNTLLKDKVYVCLGLIIALNISLFMTYVTLAPFLLTALDYTPTQIGGSYLPVALTFLFGSLWSHSLVERFGSHWVLTMGIKISLGSCILLLAATQLWPFTSAWQIVLPFALVNLGNGFIVPTGMAILLNRFSSMAGACASGLGFSQGVLAFITTLLGSSVITLGVAVMNSVLLVCALLMVVFYLLGRQSLLQA